eukprot:g6187.t1
MPSELSRRFPEFLPTWHHRAVSKLWHQTIIHMRLQQALDPSRNWRRTNLLRVSCSYFEGQGSDFLARRLILGPPDELEQLEQLEQLSGTAEAVLLQGNVDGPPPEEVARDQGRYQCEMLKGQAILRLRLQRVGAQSASEEELSLPVVKALFQENL